MVRVQAPDDGGFPCRERLAAAPAGPGASEAALADCLYATLGLQCRSFNAWLKVTRKDPPPRARTDTLALLFTFHPLAPLYTCSSHTLAL